MRQAYGYHSLARKLDKRWTILCVSRLETKASGRRIRFRAAQGRVNK